MGNPIICTEKLFIKEKWINRIIWQEHTCVQSECRMTFKGLKFAGDVSLGFFCHGEQALWCCMLSHEWALLWEKGLPVNVTLLVHEPLFSHWALLITTIILSCKYEYVILLCTLIGLAYIGIQARLRFSTSLPWKEHHDMNKMCHNFLRFCLMCKECFADG